MKLSYERKKAWYGYLFISIWLIGFIFLIPFISSIQYSLSKVTIQRGQVGMESVGFQNYIELFTKNTEFLPAFTGTLTSVIARTPLILVFSLFIAMILNQEFHGRFLARSVFFLPVILSGGIALEILSSNSFMGLVTGGDRTASLFATRSLQDALLGAGMAPSTVQYIQDMVDSVFQVCWDSGIQILIFLAGLQSIPKTMYEVAEVEGSNSWVTFWKVTFQADRQIYESIVFRPGGGHGDYQLRGHHGACVAGVFVWEPAYPLYGELRNEGRSDESRDNKPFERRQGYPGLR